MPVVSISPASGSAFETEFEITIVGAAEAEYEVLIPQTGQPIAITEKSGDIKTQLPPCTSLIVRAYFKTAYTEQIVQV